MLNILGNTISNNCLTSVLPNNIHEMANGPALK